MFFFLVGFILFFEGMGNMAFLYPISNIAKISASVATMVSVVQ